MRLIVVFFVCVLAQVALGTMGIFKTSKQGPEAISEKTKGIFKVSRQGTEAIFEKRKKAEKAIKKVIQSKKELEVTQAIRQADQEIRQATEQAVESLDQLIEIATKSLNEAQAEKKYIQETAKEVRTGVEQFTREAAGDALQEIVNQAYDRLRKEEAERQGGKQGMIPDARQTARQDVRQNARPDPRQQIRPDVRQTARPSPRREESDGSDEDDEE